MYFVVGKRAISPMKKGGFMPSVNEVVEELNAPVALKDNKYYLDGKLVRGLGKQVVRTDLGKAIANVSDTYGLIPHGEALAPALRALDGMDFRVRKFHADHDQRRVLVHMESEQTWDVGSGDDVRLSIMLNNAYDRTVSLKVLVGAFRLVCSNGMIVHHPAFSGMGVNVRIIHSKNQTKKFDVVKLTNQVAQLYGAMDKQADLWRSWNGTELDKRAEEVVRNTILQPVVGERALEDAVTRMYSGQGQDGRLTPWAIYNAVTELYRDKVNKTKTPVAMSLTATRKAGEAVDKINGLLKNHSDLIKVAA
jgi:hypothetical protein